MRSILPLIVLAAACKPTELVPPEADADTDTDTDSDTDADTDSDADADADADADTDADTDTDPGPAPNPNCPNDSYEPNQDPNTATVYQFPITNLVLDDNDVDTFALQVPAGGTVEAEITFANVLGDIDLRLKDVAGIELDVSSSTQNTETVSWTNTGAATTTVYAEADLVGMGCNTYTLVANTATGGAGSCADDVYEPNDDIATASNANSPAFGLVVDSENSRDDLYVVSLQPGDELFVDAFFKHGDGDIDVHLLDSSGSTLASSTSVTDDEDLSWVNDTGFAQSVYIRARLFGQGCVSYDLSWNTLVAGPTCVDDNWEPNDTENEAPFDPPSPLNGMVLDGNASNVDLYNILLGPGDEIIANLTFSHAIADIDLRLKESGGNVLESSTSVNDNESVTWVNDSGTFKEVFIEPYLFGTSTECAQYSLAYSIIEPAGCTDDTFEDNDTPQSVPLMSIPPNDTKLWSLVSDDDDWYAVATLPFESVTFTTEAASGDIELYLWDQNLNLIDASTGFGSFDEVRWFSLLGGLAFVEVRHDAGSCFDYELVIDRDF